MINVNYGPMLQICNVMCELRRKTEFHFQQTQPLEMIFLQRWEPVCVCVYVSVSVCVCSQNKSS